ncbi:MAG: RHS repeat-associated core domain-containing protein [Gammaproteobacteria bacterium]|nr:RHS repeat-associated core domain-containing protein [Gammaproteobacteria bacterium]
MDEHEHLPEKQPDAGGERAVLYPDQQRLHGTRATRRRGLIHMGGRVYDAEIGRFLSADPFVQDITNLQGLNRYSCENNPLSYTDPSGFFLKKLFNKVGDALGDALSSIGRAVKRRSSKCYAGN